MSNKITFVIATILLLIAFFLSFSQIKKESLTFDELAHIPAGYSYLTQQDYRINPEHPPLAKDLAALPLLFLNLNFPINSANWTQADHTTWWVQFDLGTDFIYRSQNNPEDIIFWARFPMVFVFLALGLLTFFAARSVAGNKGGLIALFLVSFSPTLLAHSKLVTNDVGAAIGSLLAVFFWTKFVSKPTWKTATVAGAALGIGLLFKFTVLLVLPVLLIATLLKLKKPMLPYLCLNVFAGVATLLILGGVYQFHILNYPAPRQVQSTISDLTPGKITLIEKGVIWMADKPGLRPYSQYARGILMAGQRTIFGNTVYFMGKVADSGWWYYFPLLYLLKVPISLHLLSLMAKVGLLYSFKRKGIAWIKDNLFLFSSLLFFFIYWAAAVAGNLNIGIRHMIPIFPFLFIFIAFGIITLAKEKCMGGKATPIIAATLLFLYAISSLFAYPSYLPYYNELAGGTKKGYEIAVDSNYDWGQDFHKLLPLVEKYNISKLNLDYFGGENPEYWLKEKYVRYDSNTSLEPKGWLAVSLNQLKLGNYEWLSDENLVDKAGNSIFLYYIQ